MTVNRLTTVSFWEKLGIYTESITRRTTNGDGINSLHIKWSDFTNFVCPYNNSIDVERNILSKYENLGLISNGFISSDYITEIIADGIYFFSSPFYFLAMHFKIEFVNICFPTELLKYYYDYALKNGINDIILQPLFFSSEEVENTDTEPDYSKLITTQDAVSLKPNKYTIKYVLQIKSLNTTVTNYQYYHNIMPNIICVSCVENIIKICKILLNIKRKFGNKQIKEGTDTLYIGLKTRFAPIDTNYREEMSIVFDTNEAYIELINKLLIRIFLSKYILSSTKYFINLHNFLHQAKIIQIHNQIRTNAEYNYIIGNIMLDSLVTNNRDFICLSSAEMNFYGINQNIRTVKNTNEELRESNIIMSELGFLKLLYLFRNIPKYNQTIHIVTDFFTKYIEIYKIFERIVLFDEEDITREVVSTSITRYKPQPLLTLGHTETPEPVRQLEKYFSAIDIPKQLSYRDFLREIDMRGEHYEEIFNTRHFHV